MTSCDLFSSTRAGWFHNGVFIDSEITTSESSDLWQFFSPDIDLWR